jgi:flagellar protein FliJ
MIRRFRLAAVLRLREAAEESARTDLARALEVQRAAVHDLTRSRQAADVELALATEAASGPLPAGRLAELAAGVAEADREVRRRDRAVAAAADALTTARERLLEATREREVVERLRDRLRQAARLEAARLEQGRLDELSTVAHVTRGTEGGLR